MVSLLSLPLFFCLYTVVRATVDCSGSLSEPNPIEDNVVVESDATCVLQVSVTGSVTVNNGATFSTTGTLTIDGGVEAYDPKEINLQGDEVILSGGLQVTGGNTVAIGKNVHANSTSLTNVTTFTLNGKATGLLATGGGTMLIDGAEVVGGGIARQGGRGDLTVCDSTIIGGINIQEVEGKISIGGMEGCEPSELDGTVSVEKGTGDVTVIASTSVASDLIVKEQTGDVTVQGAQLSDVEVSSVEGDVSLNSVVLDSDSSFKDIDGELTFYSITTDGDFAITSPTGSVTISNCNFTREDLSIEGVSETLIMSGNKEFSISATNNARIQFSDNMVTEATFSDNDELLLQGNTFESLVCSGNGLVEDQGSNVITFGDGQCAF